MSRLPSVRSLGALLLVFVALAIIHRTIPPLTFTGDEPRYAGQGVGLYSSATLRPQRAAWNDFLSKSHLSLAGHPYGSATEPAPSLGPSLAFGAFLRVGGLNAARWANFIVGCVGIGVLYGVLLREFDNRSSRVALVSIAFCAFSVPLIAYLRLLYPEVLLFTAISFALSTLVSSRRYTSAFLAGILPLFHVRASGISVALVVILIWHAWRSTKRRMLVPAILASYLGGIAVFLATQQVIFGSVFGPAFPAYAPSLALLPTRVGMQLFDVRHGLLVYSPIYLIAMAGLLTGVIVRHRVCTYASILLMVYVLTFVWSSASESWPSRFWVAALPFLAVGMCFWLTRVTQRTQWMAVLPCAVVTVVNFALFWRQPAWFLENRRASVSYAELFGVTHVHLGLFLPIDALPGGLPQFVAPIPVLLFSSIVVLVLLTLCNVLEGSGARAAAVVAFGITLVPFAAGARRVLPPSDYTLVTSKSEDRFAVNVIHSPANLSAVQLDSKLALPWSTSDYPANFEVRCFTRTGQIVTTVQPSRALILLPHCRLATSVVVTAIPNRTGSKVFRDLGMVTVMLPVRR